MKTTIRTPILILALAVAAGLDRPSYQTNPLTGEPYNVVRQEGLVTVSNVTTTTAGDHPSLTVPDLSRP